MKKDNSKHVVSEKKWEKHENHSTRPLNELLKKDRKFEWTTKCQQAFDNLKTRFTSEPVLVMPDQTKPFQIECDTSKHASGAVLTQLDSNRDRHHAHSFQRRSPPPKETMKFTIGNYWLLFEP